MLIGYSAITSLFYDLKGIEVSYLAAHMNASFPYWFKTGILQPGIHQSYYIIDVKVTILVFSSREMLLLNFWKSLINEFLIFNYNSVTTIIAKLNVLHQISFKIIKYKVI